VRSAPLPTRLDRFSAEERVGCLGAVRFSCTGGWADAGIATLQQLVFSYYGET